ncbi:MAG: hypothetical protein CMN30_28330 [Sandaracinus sp.]|nr:hypothetical protein [Sandaracinus sp.]
MLQLIFLGLLVCVGCSADSQPDEAPDAFAPLDAASEPSDAGLDATGPADAGPDCGPHGEAHGDHCDCHRGYVDQGGRCEPLPECEGDDPFEPDDIARDASACDASCARALCPADRDHVVLELAAGAALSIRVTFDAHESLRLTLYEPGRDPRFDEPIARAELVSGETLDFTVRRDGEHLLRIEGDPFDATGVYLLELM